MSIFEYTDYRSYLRNYIKKLPKRGRGELLRMASFLGVHPSLLSQILSDSKNLNLEQAQLLAKYLGFTNLECDYLFASVQLQRAGTVELRAYFQNILTGLRQQSQDLSKRVRQDKRLSSEETATFYSHWSYAAIWLGTSIKNGRTLDELTQDYGIPRERTAQILQFLTETQLVILTNGRYKMGPQSVHVSRESPHLQRHHASWRLRAIQNNDNLSNEELMYTAPISLSQADFKKLRARLAEVIKEVTDVAIQSEAEQVACFNLDFFLV